MNKSLVTNLLAFATIIVGYFLSQPVLLSIGLFSFSGAVTNWLAVHMLFEKVQAFMARELFQLDSKSLKRLLSLS